MPVVMLTSGQRYEWDRVELDFDGASVYAYEDFQLKKRYPFFHVGRVEYDDGIAYLEDERPDK